MITPASCSYQPSDYGPTVAAHLTLDHPSRLNADNPNTASTPWLTSLTVDQLFEHTTIRDRSMAEACLSGLWLYYDHLDRSHTISQSIDTPTGSYWHGIMHRREEDYGNSQYWFRLVGVHPIFSTLTDQAHQWLESIEALDQINPFDAQGNWSPNRFIDLCDQSLNRSNGAPLRPLCEQLQRLEWWVLFDWCYHQAIA